MAIRIEAIKRLYDEVVVLMHHPRPATETLATQFDAVTQHFESQIKPAIPIDCLGGSPGTNEPTWEGMDEASRGALLHELTDVRNALRQLLCPGPTDPQSLMYDEHASNFAIWSLSIYSMLLVILLGGGAMRMWTAATGPDNKAQASVAPSELRKNAEELLQSARAAQDKRKVAIALREQASQPEVVPPAISSESDEATTVGESVSVNDLDRQAQSAEEAADAAETQMRVIAAMTGRKLTESSGPREYMVLLVVVILGALGGTLRLISSMVRYIGNRQLGGSWVAYYFAMPVQGALLAPIVYMLLRVGILAPSVSGESGTSHLNLISIYAFATLTGLFANQAMVKLRDVFEEVFRPKERKEKDELAAHSPSEAQAGERP